MKPKAWPMDDLDFGSSVRFRPPLLGRPALCTIVLALAAYLGCLHGLGFISSAMGEPPVPLVLMPLEIQVGVNVPRIAPQAPNLPPDRFLKAAPAQVDDRAVVAARSEIDEKILLNPYAQYDLQTAAIQAPIRPGGPRVDHNVRKRERRPLLLVPPKFSAPVPPPPVPQPPRPY